MSLFGIRCLAVEFKNFSGPRGSLKPRFHISCMPCFRSCGVFRHLMTHTLPLMRQILGFVLLLLYGNRRPSYERQRLRCVKVPRCKFCICKCSTAIFCFLLKLSFKMATKYFFLCFSGFIIFLLVVLKFEEIMVSNFSKWTMKSTLQVNNTHSLGTNNSQLMQRERTKTLLLIYTGFWGTVKWIADRHNCGFENKFLFAANKCLSGDFELTYEKQRFEESDLVVFHAVDMPGVDHLRTLLKKRSTSQRWVYAMWESPNLTPNLAPLNGLFNSTWTYRSDSDFVSPYGSYEELSEEEKMNKMKNIPDYSQGKTELVAWMVSNCGPQLRMAFVERLKNYIKVDVFGRCSGKFGQQRGCENLNACLKTFKFYLAFENALCEDYITEKYWSRLGKTLSFFFTIYK